MTAVRAEEPGQWEMGELRGKFQRGSMRSEIYCAGRGESLFYLHREMQ